MWTTTNTAAGSSAGSSATRLSSTSIAPADPPTTITSWFTVHLVAATPQPEYLHGAFRGRPRVEVAGHLDCNFEERGETRRSVAQARRAPRRRDRTRGWPAGGRVDPR